MDLSRTLRSQRDLTHHEIIADEYETAVNQPRDIANTALFRRVSNFLPHNKKAMLDIGCGSGQMTQRFGNYFESVTAVDHSQGMLCAARKKLSQRPALFKRIHFIEDDAFNYASSVSKKFDFICAVGFLHHLAPGDLEEMLRLLSALLTREGSILLAEPLEFDPAEEPKLARWWNQPFRKGSLGYSKVAEEPDEAPIPLACLLNALHKAGLQVTYSRRGWELLPRFGGGVLDKAIIPILDVFTRKNGVVGLFVASRRPR